MGLELQQPADSKAKHEGKRVKHVQNNNIVPHNICSDHDLPFPVDTGLREARYKDALSNGEEPLRNLAWFPQGHGGGWNAFAFVIVGLALRAVVVSLHVLQLGNHVQKVLLISRILEGGVMLDQAFGDKGLDVIYKDAHVGEGKAI